MLPRMVSIFSDYFEDKKDNMCNAYLWAVARFSSWRNIAGFAWQIFHWVIISGDFTQWNAFTNTVTHQNISTCKYLERNTSQTLTFPLSRTTYSLLTVFSGTNAIFLFYLVSLIVPLTQPRLFHWNEREFAVGWLCLTSFVVDVISFQNSYYEGPKGTRLRFDYSTITYLF